MGIRFLVLFSFAAVLSLAPSARADVPTTTTSSAGTGGSASQYNPDCTIPVQAVAGTTCVSCGSGTTTACSSLSSDYNFVCNQSATSAIWCNGADRTIPADKDLTTGCAVSVPGNVWGGGAAGLLAAAAALMVRRRRRG